jgi:arabinofuranan 3-O-arabinosyltransferase
MQDEVARQAADARVRAFAGLPLTLVVGLGAAVTLLFALAFISTAFFFTSEDGTRALDVDFRVFWAAGRLAWVGEPLAAFDMARLGAVHNVDPDIWMPWLYPPAYLLLLIPFGAMPFDWAFLLSNLVSIALIALALRHFVVRAPVVWIALVFAPAYVPTLVLGQNSLIWLAGLLAALAALRDGRPVLAGIFIGCLTLKPQLGILIPVALLAAGLWRTILAATATTLLLALLPCAVTGLRYWALLAERMGEQSEFLISSIETQYLMMGPYYLLTLLGLPADVALVVQTVILLVSALAVALFWGSQRVGFDAKAAMLMTAMLLSAPYFWYYEAAMMAAIGLFMLRAGIVGPSPLGLALLFLFWLGGGLQIPNAFFHFADPRLTGAVIVTPVLAVTLVLLFAHLVAAHRRRPAPIPIQ